MEVPSFTAAEASRLIIAGEAPVGMQVSDDLDLNYRTMTTLPAGLRVNGDLSLSDSSMTKLPRGLRVSGDLDLRWTKVTALPADMIVGGSLCLADSAIQTLPDGIAVAGDLDLARSAITTLPKGLNVGGYLDLSGSAVTALPEDLRVGGGIDLSRSAITELPAGLKVIDYLDLSNTAVTSLPADLAVDGNLGLERSAIAALPDGLTVSGSLYLSDTAIRELPAGLTVGHNLSIRGTSVTSLPDDLSVGGAIFGGGAALAAETAALEDERRRVRKGSTREVPAGPEATTGAAKFPKELASPASALTIRQISELVEQEKLGEFEGKSLIEIARRVTAARAEADRTGVPQDPALMAVRNAIWTERAVRAEQARLMEGWTDEPGRKSKERAMRGVAERIVKLAGFANAIDEDDGIAPANRARPVEGGREKFDRLAGAEGMAGPARVYVMMRQAQRRGDDATLRVAATYCEYADAGVVTYDEAVTALSSLGDGLTKRMRENVKKQTMQKSGHEASPAVAADKKSGVAAYSTQHWEQSR